eukprot:698996-Pyramimonas_sp.AAC.1
MGKTLWRAARVRLKAFQQLHAPRTLVSNMSNCYTHGGLAPFQTGALALDSFLDNCRKRIQRITAAPCLFEKRPCGQTFRSRAWISYRTRFSPNRSGNVSGNTWRTMKR